MPRITKAELQAHIANIESELGVRNNEVKRLSRELDAFYYSERPSRRRSEHPGDSREGAPRIERHGQRTIKRWLPN